MTPLLRACHQCGRPHHDTGTTCPNCHKPKAPRRPQAKLNQQVYRSAAWRQARAIALERDNHQCQHCGTDTGLVVHHDIEVAPGMDPYDVDNLETLCRPCHRREHNRREHAH